MHRFRKGRVAQPTVYRHEPLGAPPEPKYAAYVAWGGVEVTQKEAILERALAVPVLMYHRIAEADDGPRSPGPLVGWRPRPSRPSCAGSARTVTAA